MNVVSNIQLGLDAINKTSYNEATSIHDPNFPFLTPNSQNLNSREHDDDFQICLRWNSKIDLDDFEIDCVQLEITPVDADTGLVSFSNYFLVDNYQK